MCHHIKHIGLARIMADSDQLNFDDLIRHFMRINNCGRTAFARHKKDVFDKWKERSKHDWQVDLGKLSNAKQ